MKIVIDSNIIFSALISGEEITVIPKFAVSPDNWHKAYEICKDIDEKDTPFVALSLELEIPLCTNDKKLYEKLKKKGFDNFVTVKEFITPLTD